MNPGFCEVTQKALEKEKDFDFLGAQLAREVLVPSGDWRPFYPKMEVQRNNYLDTFSCVSFANNNIEEMMHKCRYDKEVNRSDRFLSVISGTIPGRGNSHNAVAEAKRKFGVVDEEVYPFTPDMNQSTFFKPIPEDIKIQGLMWKEDLEFGYEKVSNSNFKEVLQFSPIQVAVDSRTNKTSQVQGYDHSVVLTHIDDKNVPHVFDSYVGRFETYDPDYPFSYGTRFHYKRKLTLKLDDMKMQLIRDKDNGRIFLVDSDGRLHHIDAPTSFTEFFGRKAWQDEDWVNMDSEVISRYEEGEAISIKKANLADAVKDLFSKFGKK